MRAIRGFRLRHRQRVIGADWSFLFFSLPSLETRNSGTVLRQAESYFTNPGAGKVPALGCFYAVAFGDGGCCRFGRRQLDKEARADRKIVFDVNGAAVFGDDARGDGQA